MDAASSRDLHARQHHREHLSFLESARMDRELVREIGQSFQRRGQKSPLSITAALANMSTQRFLVLAAGVLLLVVGLLALRFPVFLPDFDRWGFQINCGSGFQTTLTQAGIADSAGTHFIDQCHAAIAMRRAWAIPLAVAGALLLSGLLVRPPSTRQAAGLSVTPDGADGRWRPVRQPLVPTKVGARNVVPHLAPMGWRSDRSIGSSSSATPRVRTISTSCAVHQHLP
jgi:hypothetical protein